MENIKRLEILTLIASNDLFGDGIDMILASRLFKKGTIKSASVVPIPSTNDSWELIFETNNGTKVPCLKARTEVRKTYKSWRAAIIDAEKVGLEKVIVNLK